ncbi:type IV secretory system conjugative DNA transfer family protein [Mesomycoplasma neurolyticum]|uniref:Conjugal transfer coupling protein TraG n=1 Tax=Mesomycoplasma neurolyticum TaxID=2120 RepID=A0A449A5R3_9BACT|nr:type IV secretory system conjugative DNA transfer family protein [Mesomycoplasma neurolyticum]VEU59595.1 conjugal transfer coupling protein TraG [Mesomycoplasma neurolyticum]
MKGKKNLKYLFIFILFWIPVFLLTYILFPFSEISSLKKFVDIFPKLKNYWKLNITNWNVISISLLSSFIFSFTFLCLVLIFFKFKKNKNKFEKLEEGGASFLWDEPNKKGSFSEFSKIYFKNFKNQKPGWVVSYKRIGSKIKYFVSTETHAKIIGTTGSGKTQRFIIPSAKYNINIKNTEVKPNIVLIDPKGELYLELKNDLDKNNYQIFTLDLTNPLISDGFNFLSKIWKTFHNQNMNKLERESLAFSLLADVIESLDDWNTSGDNKFWSDSSKNCLKIIGKFMLYYSTIDKNFKKQHFNLASFNQFLSYKEFSKGKWINILQNSQSQEIKNFFLSEVKPLIENNDRTLTSQLSGAVNAIVKFNNDLAIKSWSCRHNIEIEKIILDSHLDNGKPFAIFIKFPDHKKDRHRYISILIDQIYQTAIDIANASKNQKLKRTLLFFGDEFGNLPVIKDFDNKVTIARSRNIFFSIVLQDLNQLAKYKNDKKIIENNTNLTIFLNSSDHETLKKTSEILGQSNVVKTSFSNSKNDKSKSSTDSLSNKPLVSIEELKNISPKVHLIIQSGIKPSRVNSTYAYDVWNTKSNEIEKKEIRIFNEKDYFYLFTEIAKNDTKDKNLNKELLEIIEKEKKDELDEMLLKTISTVKKEKENNKNFEQEEEFDVEDLDEIEFMDKEKNDKVNNRTKQLAYLEAKLKSGMLDNEEYKIIEKKIKFLKGS